MTDDEFLKFAHEADQSAHNRRHVYAFTYPQLKRAFEAVEAHEREWVGLTDDERRYICKKHQQHDAFARAIEAKLKEKNT